MQPSPSQVSWVLEDDPAAWYSHDTLRKAFRSTCVTLTLGVLGSTILPIPFALSKTGLLLGCLVMLLVAAANDATSCYLIRAAAATGKTTYESLAEWAGGTPWKVFTQVTLVLLLWGTMCGGLALISDVALVMVEQGWGSSSHTPPPAWLNGRTCMAAVAVFVLFPLCLQRHMRELETAATAGVVLVVALIVLLGHKAWQAGFPAIHTGDLPVWSLKMDEHLPEAFAVVGYAFYMQPMMMPLLAEVPPGPGGMRVMYNAVHTTLFGVAFTIYLLMGLFGASLYGQQTQGNIMVNRLVEGRAAVLVLYGTMLLYLSLGMTTTQFALRQSLDLLLVGEGAPFTWSRQLAVTTLTVGSSLAVALVVPTAAEKIYAVVGATAVCVVCYIIPVFIHIKMVRRHKAAVKQQFEEDSTAAQLRDPLIPEALWSEATAAAGHPEAGGPQAAWPGTSPAAAARTALHAYLGSSWTVREVVLDILVPCGILVMGVGFSIAALYVAVKAYYH